MTTSSRPIKDYGLYHNWNNDPSPILGEASYFNMLLGHPAGMMGGLQWTGGSSKLPSFGDMGVGRTLDGKVHRQDCNTDRDGPS